MNINLNELAGGATAEQINREIERVLENIKDPNTDQTVKRKLTITMTFTPDKGDSDIVGISTVCKASLAAPEGTNTMLIVGMDGSGKIQANEWGKDRMKGQLAIDEEAESVPEYEYTEGVIDFQKRAKC